mmetsp:Transcript_132554/g.412133  ORF Transcript_132554/g.412133 Transcript_132554/m.412133 type:complete len:212 (+) Transcript_132554:1198-1833(+)
MPRPRRRGRTAARASGLGSWQRTAPARRCPTPSASRLSAWTFPPPPRRRRSSTGARCSACGCRWPASSTPASPRCCCASPPGASLTSSSSGRSTFLASGPRSACSASRGFCRGRSARTGCSAPRSRSSRAARSPSSATARAWRRGLRTASSSTPWMRSSASTISRRRRPALRRGPDPKRPCTSRTACSTPRSRSTRCRAPASASPSSWTAS